MITIAENKQYTLQVDIDLNRAFLTIVGFWRSRADIPAYLEDWDQAIDLLKPGFTLLTDAREMVIHPSEVREIHAQAHKKIIEFGVKKVAELPNEEIAKLQLSGFSAQCGMPKENFSSKAEAMAWLDKG
ncbi:hypothetical protein JKA74_10770 [Marivirga sp. S37H4]|uniref:Uncharacterized protein n=1 Tax=Marivirga aurantiaca TaxID=2802615 RepID=A0A934WZA5_9BACT|nr:hypothetical protein [Marivirga aurantiaca]MBK6265520.1 hypothetical protein [Marivirga aurantiaca]